MIICIIIIIPLAVTVTPTATVTTANTAGERPTPTHVPDRLLEEAARDVHQVGEGLAFSVQVGAGRAGRE